MSQAQQAANLNGTIADGLANETRSHWADAFRRFCRNKAAVTALIVLVLLYVAAIFAPQLASEAKDAYDGASRLLPPSWKHPLGTDHMGSDVLARMIWGSRVSMTVGFVSMGFAIVLGTLVGAVAGFYGGTWIDLLLMRIAEAIKIIPTFYLLLAIVSLVRPSIFNVMLVIGLTSWPSPASMVRGQFLSLRQRDFSEASRSMGARDARLIFKHILPNAAGPIIVSASLRIGSAILTESSLSYLGLGTQPPDVSWGQLLSYGRAFLKQAPWISLFPGLAIFIVVMCFNFVGDGLRDALDPKMKR